MASQEQDVVLGHGTGVASPTLGAPVGAIVLSKMRAFVCVVAFTVLIWAAIQDGKQPGRAAAE